jgi:hypothetical protein
LKRATCGITLPRVAVRVTVLAGRYLDDAVKERPSRVGLVLYRPVNMQTPAGRTTYELVRPPRGMSPDAAIRRMAREIRAAAAR